MAALSEEEALCLIQLWGEDLDSVQVQIEGCKRSKDVFNKLADSKLTLHSRRQGSRQDTVGVVDRHANR